jgi:hypothetical protein
MSDGKWIFGYPVKIGNKTHIITYADPNGTISDRVLTRTVCQRTGFKDRKGKDIYDDDLYEIYEHTGKVYKVAYKSGTYIGHRIDTPELFSALAYRDYGSSNGILDSNWIKSDVIIIGNLWD